jgi:hypothetical protein
MGSSTRLGTHRYSGDDSQSGCGTQANTYADRSRSQGASSDAREGSLERRLNGRQLYRSAQSIRASGHPRRISVCLSRRPLLFRRGASRYATLADLSTGGMAGASRAGETVFLTSRPERRQCGC